MRRRLAAALALAVSGASMHAACSRSEGGAARAGAGGAGGSSGTAGAATAGTSGTGGAVGGGGATADAGPCPAPPDPWQGDTWRWQEISMGECGVALAECPELAAPPLEWTPCAVEGVVVPGCLFSTSGWAAGPTFLATKVVGADAGVWAAVRMDLDFAGGKIRQALFGPIPRGEGAAQTFRPRAVFAERLNGSTPETSCVPRLLTGSDGWACLATSGDRSHVLWFDGGLPGGRWTAPAFAGGNIAVACTADLVIAEGYSGYPAFLRRDALAPVVPFWPAGIASAVVFGGNIVNGAVWARAEIAQTKEIWRVAPAESAFTRVVTPGPGRAARAFGEVDGELVWIEGPDDDTLPGPYQLNAAPLTPSGIGAVRKVRDIPFMACTGCSRWRGYGEGYFATADVAQEWAPTHIYRVSDGRHWALPAAFPASGVDGIANGEIWYYSRDKPPGVPDGPGRVRLRIDSLGPGD